MIRPRSVLPRLLVAILFLELAEHALTDRGLSAAAPQLKVYFASEFKDEAYQKKTYTKVASAWKRPASLPEAGKKAVVIAVIQKDGTVPAPTLHLASGSDPWDRAALEAVRKAAPFDPLPKTCARPSVEVHFHFEYD